MIDATARRRAAGGVLLSAALLPLAAMLSGVDAAGNLQRRQDLAFGAVLVSSQAGTVTVTPTGTVSVNGGVVHLGGAEPARFRNTGDQTQPQVSVTLPSSATVTSGPNSMRLEDFTSRTSFEQQGNSGAIFTLIDVGAKININGGQPSGTYIGDFTVIVTFE